MAIDELLHEKLQWRYKEPEETLKVEKEEEPETDEE